MTKAAAAKSMVAREPAGIQGGRWSEASGIAKYLRMYKHMLLLLYVQPETALVIIIMIVWTYYSNAR